MPNKLRSETFVFPIFRRGHTVLQQALPPKQEYIFLVRMSPIQRTLYREFMSSLQVQNLGSWASTNPLKAFAVCCKVKSFEWNLRTFYCKVKSFEWNLRTFCCKVNSCEWNLCTFCCKVNSCEWNLPTFYLSWWKVSMIKDLTLVTCKVTIKMIS